MPTRGRLSIGSCADIVLVEGDPTTDITATQRLRAVWIAGREVKPEMYANSAAERECITGLRESTKKIITAITDMWPAFPTPEVIHREDGEILGHIIPTSGGWQPTTTFGAPLGDVTSHDEALDIVHTLGLTALADRWWVLPLDETLWHEAMLIEAQPDRLRLRWNDPMADQPPSGQWYDLDDIDLAQTPPDTGHQT